MGHIQEGGDVADAHLGFEEDAEDADAGPVAEDLEELGQIGETLGLGHGGEDSFNHVLMGDGDVTAFNLALFHRHLTFHLRF